MSDTEAIPTREEIERRAYEIYLMRGSEEGQALADWLAAEQELSAASQANASAALVKRASA